MGRARESLLLALVLLTGLPSSSDGEWVLAFYAGAIHTSPTDLRIDQPARGTALVFPSVPFEGKSLTSPIYYGYRIARSIPGAGTLYVEAEFIHAKAYAHGAEAPGGAGVRNGIPATGVPFQSVVQQFAMSHGLNFILINVAMRRPVAGDRVTLAVRAGAGPLLPHVESEIEGAGQEGYEFAGAGFQAGAGVELRVWRRVSVCVDYKWTHARPQVPIASGTAELAMRSHHLALGVSAAF